MASVLGDEIDVLAKAKRALDADYTPNEDEEYMSEQQLNYFRVLLLEWKKSILSASEFTLQTLQDGPIREPDLNDRASSETDWGIELRTRRVHVHVQHARAAFERGAQQCVAAGKLGIDKRAGDVQQFRGQREHEFSFYRMRR